MKKAAILAPGVFERVELTEPKNAPVSAGEPLLEIIVIGVISLP